MYNNAMLLWIADECEKNTFAVVGAHASDSKDLADLAEQELVELDPAGPDEAGNIKVAVTDFGAKSAVAIASRTPEPIVEKPVETPPAVPAWAQPQQPAMPTEPVGAAPVWARPTGRLHVESADPMVVAALEDNQPTERMEAAMASTDAIAQRHTPYQIGMTVEPNSTLDAYREMQQAADPTGQVGALHGNTEGGQLMAPSSVQIITGLTLPTKRKRTPKAKPIDAYPFAGMDVGTAFYVPPSAEFPNPVKDFAGLVNMANRRHSTEKVDDNGNVIMREGRQRTLKDAAGNYIVDGNGARMTESTQVPELVYSKKFDIYDAKKVPGQTMTQGAFVFRVI